MRGLAIGCALAIVLVLVPGGHLLLVLLVPLALVALVVVRPSWQPLATRHRLPARRSGPHDPEWPTAASRRRWA